MCDADADKHKHLSSAGVRGVIAGGIIGIICVLALAMILKDLHGAHAMKVHTSQGSMFQCNFGPLRLEPRLLLCLVSLLVNDRHWQSTSAVLGLQGTAGLVICHPLQRCSEGLKGEWQ